jgi:hypothetical protein
MWWWIAGAVVLLLIAVILWSEVRVRVKFYREGENDEVDAALSALFGLVRMRYKVPVVKLRPMLNGLRMKITKEHQGPGIPYLDANISREDVEIFIKRVRRLITHMNNYKAWMAGTFKHLHIVEFRWETRFGLGDAPQTGVAAGVIWSLKSVVLGYISRWFPLDKRPNLQVVPLFTERAFRTDVTVRTKIRVYHLIAAAVMLMIRVLQTEGGWKVWFRELYGIVAKKRPAA